MAIPALKRGFLARILPETATDAATNGSIGVVAAPNKPKKESFLRGYEFVGNRLNQLG